MTSWYLWCSGYSGGSLAALMKLPSSIRMKVSDTFTSSIDEISVWDTMKWKGTLRSITKTSCLGLAKFISRFFLMPSRFFVSYRIRSLQMVIPQRSKLVEFSLLLIENNNVICVPGNSVSIMTDYRLDGPGSNPGVDEIFRPSRPALGPTQPPVKWAPGLSWG